MATFVGTANADNITGTNAGGDTLLGNAGNDTLTGLAGADVLNGGTGDDSMIGAGGNDSYYVDSAGDVIVEGTGGGTDTVGSSISYKLNAGAQVENLVYVTPLTNTTSAALVGAVSASTDAVTLIGNEFAQTIYGTAGANTLDGGRNATPTDNDTLVGGAGDDTYVIRNTADVLVDSAGNDIAYVVAADLQAQGQAIATYTLATGVAVETLSAANQSGTESFSLTGNDLATTVVGNMGANTLNGGIGGVDTLIGLGGDDTYVLNAATDVIQETTGNDTVTFGIGNSFGGAFTLAADVSIETIRMGNGVVSAAGNNLANTIYGDTVAANNTNETLNGGTGIDTLIGGTGNDTYVVDSSADVITEGGFQADGTTATTDTVVFNGTTGGYKVGEGVAIGIVATGTAQGVVGAGTINLTTASNVVLVGNTASQTIYGNAGNNVLDGSRTSGTNADTLYGGAGNDTYRVYNQTDRVSDASVTSAGAVFTVGAGDAGGTDTVFTSATYSLAAGVAGQLAGAAFIENLSAADQSGTTAINLTGNLIGNYVVGNMGDNLINGTANTVAATGDTLVGLGGNDTYTVNQAADVVIEAAGGGVNDIINFGAGYATNAYVLQAGSEVDRINMSGTVLSVTGNEFGQVIVGNATTASTLIGGGGADLLIGGSGNDVYNVADSSAVVSDTAGMNTILYSGATGGFAAGNGVAVTTLGFASATGVSADLNSTNGTVLVGNNGVQTLFGNANDNILNGGGGTDTGGRGDTLIGGTGNDTYRVYTSNLVGGVISATIGDQIVESAGQGTDTVFTSASYGLSTGVENLVAADQANVTTLTLLGNATANGIAGSNGNNVLAGGDGNDTLTGLGGADTFHFSSTVGAANADIITDFSEAQGDKISLDAGIFTGFGGAIDAAEFQMGTTATGSTATILYDQSTGRLFYDADGAGAGAAQIFATVNPGTTITAADFVLTPAGTLPTP